MKNGIFKDVSVITISKIVSALIAFINTALLSRFRTLTEYGTYSQMILAISLVVTICDLGLPYAVTYFGSKAEKREDRNHFFSVFYTVDTTMSIIIGVIMVAIIPFLKEFFNNDTFPSYWYFLLIYPWIRIIDGTIENALVIAKKTQWIAVYRLIYGASSCFIVIIIKLLGLGFNEYLISYTVVLSILTICAYGLVSKAFGRLKVAFDKSLVKEILKYALPVGMASAVGTINIEFDKLVIGNMCSTEELAIYTNASKVLPIGLIATSVNMVILPLIVKKVSEKKIDSAISVWNKSLAISLKVVSVLTFALIVFAPEVITFIYSSSYVSGTNVFRVYCVSYLLGCTYWGTMLNATGKTKCILYCSVISCVFNIVLDIILYKLFGMIGPAIATVTSQFILCYAQIVFSKKALKVKKLLSVKRMGLVIIKNVIIAVPFAVLHYFLKANTNLNHVVLAFVIGGIWMLAFVLLEGKKIYREFGLLNRQDEVSEQ